MRHQRLFDVLCAKALLLWAVVIWACADWVLIYPRGAAVVLVLACLTTTTVVWLRIQHRDDAWREGYKTALKDTKADVVQLSRRR